MTVTHLSVDDLIEALESGDFHHGVGALKIAPSEESPVKYDRHCCLGVACEVAGYDFENYWAYIRDADNYPTNPEPVTPKWAYWLRKDVQAVLSSINDGSDSFDRVLSFLGKYKDMLENREKYPVEAFYEAASEYMAETELNPADYQEEM